MREKERRKRVGKKRQNALNFFAPRAPKQNAPQPLLGLNFWSPMTSHAFSASSDVLTNETIHPPSHQASHQASHQEAAKNLALSRVSASKPPKHHVRQEDGGVITIAVLDQPIGRCTHQLQVAGNTLLNENHSPENLLIRLSELELDCPISLYENLIDDASWPYGQTHYRTDLGGRRVANLLSHQVAIAIERGRSPNPSDFRPRAALQMMRSYERSALIPDPRVRLTVRDLLEQAIEICLNGRKLPTELDVLIPPEHPTLKNAHEAHLQKTTAAVK